MNDQIKAAELRGYSKGYQSGRRRKKREISQERRRREEQAFLDRAFLALLPTAMTVQGWTIGDNKVSSGDERVELARRWAIRAAKKRPLA